MSDPTIRCPDGGACHHDCPPAGTAATPLGLPCYRVTHAGPLSAAGYPHDDWPPAVRSQHATPAERDRLRQVAGLLAPVPQVFAAIGVHGQGPVGSILITAPGPLRSRSVRPEQVLWEAVRRLTDLGIPYEGSHHSRWLRIAPDTPLPDNPNQETTMPPDPTPPTAPPFFVIGPNGSLVGSLAQVPAPLYEHDQARLQCAANAAAWAMYSDDGRGLTTPMGGAPTIRITGDEVDRAHEVARRVLGHVNAYDRPAEVASPAGPPAIGTEEASMPEAVALNVASARERLCHAQVAVGDDHALAAAFQAAMDVLDGAMVTRPGYAAAYPYTDAAREDVQPVSVAGALYSEKETAAIKAAMDAGDVLTAQRIILDKVAAGPPLPPLIDPTASLMAAARIRTSPGYSDDVVALAKDLEQGRRYVTALDPDGFKPNVSIPCAPHPSEPRIQGGLAAFVDALTAIPESERLGALSLAAESHGLLDAVHALGMLRGCQDLPPNEFTGEGQVTACGGGMFDVLVDRDTGHYPRTGARVRWVVTTDAGGHPVPPGAPDSTTEAIAADHHLANVLRRVLADPRARAQIVQGTDTITPRLSVGTVALPVTGPEAIHLWALARAIQGGEVKPSPTTLLAVVLDVGTATAWAGASLHPHLGEDIVTPGPTSTGRLIRACRAALMAAGHPAPAQEPDPEPDDEGLPIDLASTAVVASALDAYAEEGGRPGVEDRAAEEDMLRGLAADLLHGRRAIVKPAPANHWSGWGATETAETAETAPQGCTTTRPVVLEWKEMTTEARKDSVRNTVRDIVAAGHYRTTIEAAEALRSVMTDEARPFLDALYPLPGSLAAALNALETALVAAATVGPTYGDRSTALEQVCDAAHGVAQVFHVRPVEGWTHLPPDVRAARSAATADAYSLAAITVRLLSDSGGDAAVTPVHQGEFHLTVDPGLSVLVTVEEAAAVERLLPGTVRIPHGPTAPEPEPEPDAQVGEGHDPDDRDSQAEDRHAKGDIVVYAPAFTRRPNIAEVDGDWGSKGGYTVRLIGRNADTGDLFTNTTVSCGASDLRAPETEQEHLIARLWRATGDLRDATEARLALTADVDALRSVLAMTIREA